jgi:site-specific DNA recombinase
VNQRAAFYARVSTAHQEEERTVASQVEALEQAAASMDLTVPADRRYVDEGFSGTRLDRPALDALRDAVADGLVDMILIYDPDRLARNYVYQQVLLEELAKRGAEVHFVVRPIGEQAEDRLLVQMQGVIAEYERAKFLERSRRGKRHKVRTGQMLPFTHAPYGYAIVRTPEAPQGTVVIEEVEAQRVRAMYSWMSEDGLSLWKATKRANAMGWKTRQGKRWCQSSVYHVLTNPIYTGFAVYGKREPCKPQHPRRPGTYTKQANSSYRLRPESQWIRVGCRSQFAWESRRPAFPCFPEDSCDRESCGDLHAPPSDAIRLH